MQTRIQILIFPNHLASYFPANRVLSALVYIGYAKLLRLESPNDAALGQLVTFCTGDQERINEAVVAGTLLLGTPVLFLLSAGYAWYLVGPYSLLGLLVILLFYPIMVNVPIWFLKTRLKFLIHREELLP